MVKRITLTLAVVIAVLATVPASAGPHDSGQAAFSYDDNAYNRNGW